MSSLASVTDGLTLGIYRRVLAAFCQQYPWLDAKNIFYNDTGAKMQKLEGEIGLEMFKWAMDKSIPILSVHDSFAVQAKHAEVVWLKMTESWSEVTGR